MSPQFRLFFRKKVLDGHLTTTTARLLTDDLIKSQMEQDHQTPAVQEQAKSGAPLGAGNHPAEGTQAKSALQA